MILLLHCWLEALPCLVLACDPQSNLFSLFPKNAPFVVGNAAVIAVSLERTSDVCKSQTSPQRTSIEARRCPRTPVKLEKRRRGVAPPCWPNLVSGSAPWPPSELSDLGWTRCGGFRYRLLSGCKGLTKPIDRKKHERDSKLARLAQALQFTQLYFGPSAFSASIASDTPTSGYHGYSASAGLPFPWAPFLAPSQEQRPPSPSPELL